MADFTLDPAALQDIEQLAEWLNAQAGPQAKMGFLTDLAQTAGLLTSFPEMGRVSPRQPAMRELLFGKRYKLYYGYNKTRDQVQVLAVVDTRRDPGRSGN